MRDDENGGTSYAKVEQTPEALALHKAVHDAATAALDAGVYAPSVVAIISQVVGQVVGLFSTDEWRTLARETAIKNIDTSMAETVALTAAPTSDKKH